MPAQRSQRGTHPTAYWPVELSIGTAIDLVVEGRNGDTFGIDSRTAC
jgi:hypothetical protein